MVLVDMCFTSLSYCSSFGANCENIPQIWKGAGLENDTKNVRLASRLTGYPRRVLYVRTRVAVDRLRVIMALWEEHASQQSASYQYFDIFRKGRATLSFLKLLDEAFAQA